MLQLAQPEPSEGSRHEFCCRKAVPGRTLIGLPWQVARWQLRHTVRPCCAAKWPAACASAGQLLQRVVGPAAALGIWPCPWRPGSHCGAALPRLRPARILAARQICIPTTTTATTNDSTAAPPFHKYSSMAAIGSTYPRNRCLSGVAACERLRRWRQNLQPLRARRSRGLWGRTLCSCCERGAWWRT